MSTHVLLNLLNELGGKSDKMRGLSTILSLFHNMFDKFNKTSTNVRFYLSHDNKITKNRILGVELSRFCHLLHSVKMEVITFLNL